MSDILQLVPWGAIILLVVEYFIGKTKRVKSNSVIELILVGIKSLITRKK